MTDTSLSYISALTGLKELDLSACGSFTSTALQALIRARPHLELLKVKVSAESLDDFLRCIGSYCRYLKDLQVISDSKSTLTSPRTLAQGCPLLEDLSLFCSLTDNDDAIAILAEFSPRLRCTDMALTATDKGLVTLSRGCPDLRRVSIFNPHVTDAAILSLAEHCHKFKSIGINCTNQHITSRSLSALFQSNPGLTSVSLFKGKYTVDDEAVLTLAHCCPKLISIRIFGQPCLTESPFIALISRCVDLTELSISDCNIFDALVDALAHHCQHLKTAIFDNCPNLTEHSLLTLLAHFRCLNYVSLRGCGVAVTYKEGLYSQIRRRPVSRRLIVFIDDMVM